jgi:hypothetical protein
MAHLTMLNILVWRDVKQHTSVWQVFTLTFNDNLSLILWHGDAHPALNPVVTVGCGFSHFKDIGISSCSSLESCGMGDANCCCRDNFTGSFWMLLLHVYSSILHNLLSSWSFISCIPFSTLIFKCDLWFCHITQLLFLFNYQTGFLTYFLNFRKVHTFPNANFGHTI